MRYRKYRLTGILFNIIIVILLIIDASGCNKISQGDQRKKFEYLYKMNNYATLFSEYTGIISYNSDRELYNKRMNKLYMDVDGMNIISGYEPSSRLKTKFLAVIDTNLMILQNFVPRDSSDSANIRNEFEIIKMNENVDEFINELNNEISVVGKE